MLRIDRYVLALFLAHFVAGLLVFVTLFITIDAITTTLRSQAGILSVAQYYLYHLPSVAYQMLPVAALMGTVFTLGVMNRSNELVALFSLGMSLARICLPILAAVLIISALAFWFNDRVTPILNQRKNLIYYTEILRKPGLYSTVKDNKIWYRSKNILFYLKTIQAELGIGQGLTMYFMDDSWRLAQMITAKEVQMSGVQWELRNGTITIFASEANEPLTQIFDKKTIAVGDEVKDLQKNSPTVDTLSAGAMKNYIQKNREAGLNTIRYEVDYYAKFGFAFAGFVMSFLGIPFSVARQRSGGAVGQIGITMVLAFAYWTLYSSGLAMGQHGYVAPVVGAWGANILMVAFALFVTLRLKR